MYKVIDTSVFEDPKVYVTKDNKSGFHIVETLKENFASQSLVRNIDEDLQKMQLIGELVRNHQHSVYTKELENQIKNIIS